MVKPQVGTEFHFGDRECYTRVTFIFEIRGNSLAIELRHLRYVVAAAECGEKGTLPFECAWFHLRPRRHPPRRRICQRAL